MRTPLLAALLSAAAIPVLAQNAKPAARPAPPPPAKPAAKPSITSAKPAAPPTAKPAPAPAKPAPPRVVKGTTQLTGDVGKLGVQYTLGNDNGAINVTLDSAEFRVTRVNFGTVMIAPEAAEKLLVLSYTVQNPNPNELAFETGSVQFTVVDAQDVNHEGEEPVARTGGTLLTSLLLKPAQKLSVYSVVKVPAKGPVPKLIMRRGTDNTRVVRYDLRGQVKAVPAPFGDPTDAGVSALQEVPAAQPGTAYPVLRWDVKLVSAAYASGPLGDLEPAEGKRFLLLTVEAVNRGPDRVEYGPSTLSARLVLADGDKIDCQERLLRGGAAEDLISEAAPGDRFTGRLVCEVPKDAQVKALLLSEFTPNNGRWYRYDASVLK